jgi:hypothetical protein
MQQFDQLHRRLPPAYSDQGASAFVPLLPFLEEASLFATYDPNRRLSVEPNKTVAASELPVLRCPAMLPPAAAPGPGWASYGVCTGSAYGHFVNSANPEYHNGAIIDPAKGRTRVAQISGQDGTSKTFLAGDLDFGLSNFAGGGATYWADGYPFCSSGTTAGVFNSDRLITGFWELNTFRSDHAGGVNLVMVDGSVHFIQEAAHPDTLNRLANRNDGREIDEDY